ncbi:MAG: cytochrome-c oxidase, cbb3-type subunit III [Alphaproteobacteria bacterium]
MPTKLEKDAITGMEIRDHEWDGLRELNTPLPKWWVYILYATILWSAVYVVLYPGVPGFRGVLDWAQREEIVDRLAESRAAQAARLDRMGASDLAAVAADPELGAFAIAGGRAAFADNCAPCHGQGGAGRPGGFPALVDDDWIWGGSPEAIHQTIAYGIRSSHDETRVSDMPRFGADGLLTRESIGDVAEYVLSLSGTAEDPAAAKRGGVIFTENCAVCHGEDGRGIADVGAPDLADAIWLYGGDRASVAASITSPHGGVMPAWTGRLDEATIKMLALYVHGLGGGE